MTATLDLTPTRPCPVSCHASRDTVDPVRAEYTCPMTNTTTCTPDPAKQERCPSC